MLSRDSVPSLSSALVCDAAQRLWGPERLRAHIPVGLSRLSGRQAAVGTAYTMRISPAHRRDGSERERWFAALDSVPANAIIVMQVIGDLGGATIGDVVAHRLSKRGVTGVVIDGPARDIEDLREYGVSVWAREVTMRGMSPSDANTEVGIDIVCGNAVVCPNDLVVCDSDGIFIVPADHSGEVLKIAEAFQHSEGQTHRAIENGATLVDSYPSKSAVEV